MQTADFTDQTGVPTTYMLGFDSSLIEYTTGTGNVLVTTLISGYSRTYIPDPSNSGHFLAKTAVGPGPLVGSALAPSVNIAAASLVGAGSIF
jgi:hypothetical protein